MPNPKINWINDHTQICDRLDERVQLMEGYLNSKPDDFDGIAAKRFLLEQAREQVSWYRQSIDAIDYVGAVAHWKPDNPFWSITYLPTTSVKPSAAQNTSAILRSLSCPNSGHDPIPTTMRGLMMLVKLQTPKYLIYAELDTPQRVTDLALKNRIPARTCYAILHEIEQRGDFQITWGLADDGYSNTVQISRVG